MGKIGFSTKSVEEQQDDNTTKTDQTEDYTHTISFLGLPVIKITKKHIIDSKVTEK